MSKPKTIKELLTGGGHRLAALQERVENRGLVLQQVRAALPAQLAETVLTAGLENGRLTLSVAGAVWATRLRYLTEELQIKVGQAAGTPIAGVRIKVARVAG